MRGFKNTPISIIILTLLVGLGCSAGTLLVRAPLPTPTPTKTPRLTFTPTLIPTETSTPTPSPTWTTAPTDTPVPPTDTPVSEAQAEAETEEQQPQAVVNADDVNIREGPGTNYAQTGQVNAGHTSDILGRNNDAQWIFIDYPGGQGWIAVNLVQIQGDINAVGVIQVEAPPTPVPQPPTNTPQPTPPPEPTATPVPSYPFPAVPVIHPTGGDIEFRITGFVWEGNLSTGFGEAASGFEMHVVTPSGTTEVSEVSVGPSAGSSTAPGAGDNHSMNFQFKHAPYVPGVYKVTLMKDGQQMAPTIDITAQAGPPYSYAHIDFLRQK